MESDLSFTLKLSAIFGGIILAVLSMTVIDTVFAAIRRAIRKLDSLM